MQITDESDDDNNVDDVSLLANGNDGGVVMNGFESPDSASMMDTLVPILDINHNDNYKKGNDISETSCSTITPEKGKTYINFF